MSSTAIADVSISGEAKVKSINDGYFHLYIESDLTITGKSGDNSVIAQISLDNYTQPESNKLEQLYITSKVAGLDVKAGMWKHDKSELEQDTYFKENNSDYFITSMTPRQAIEVSKSVGGVKFTYFDWAGPGEGQGAELSAETTLGGMTLYHKDANGKDVTKVYGSLGDIDLMYHLKDFNGPTTNGTYDIAISLATSIQGIDIEFVDVSSDAGTYSDGFFGKYLPFTAYTPGIVARKIVEANGLKLSTSLLGGEVSVTQAEILELHDYAAPVYVTGDRTKLTYSRKLSSGVAFEASYIDYLNPNYYPDSINLEIAVKF